MDIETELIADFVPTCIEPEFGAQHLSSYCKQSAQLSHHDLARYTLDADIRYNGTRFGQRFPKRYFDGTGTVRGTLQRFPEGTPVEGATVTVSGHPALEVTTGADGAFALAEVPAGTDVALRIEPGDGSVVGVSAIEVLPGAGVELGTLRVGGRVGWKGRITGPDGQPLPGAVVTLHAVHLAPAHPSTPGELALHRRPPALHRAVTDSEGRYGIASVGRNPVVVVARAAGYVPSVVIVDPVRGEDPAADVVHDRELEKGVQIAGAVVTAEGRPAAGAALILLHDLQGGGTLLTARYRITDAKGRFRFTTVRRPDERLVVFSGTTLFTWDERLTDGMIIRLR